MKYLGVVVLGGILAATVAPASENAEDNRAISEFGAKFERVYRYDKIWIGKYQVQKSAACTDGQNIYATVTDCVRPGYASSSENEPNCAVNGYGLVQIAAPVHFERWACVEDRGGEQGCVRFGNVPASHDISGIAACSVNQQPVQQQQQQRLQQKRRS